MQVSALPVCSVTYLHQLSRLQVGGERPEPEAASRMAANSKCVQCLDSALLVLCVTDGPAGKWLGC